jgi:UDP:flavonoid glycosyltransferase YjiC (YdhE family)
MSRFLLSTMPAVGHVHPFLPVAAELVARGHGVVWHSGPAFRSLIEATGAQFAAAEATPDFDRIPVEPDAGTAGMGAAISVIRRLFVDRVAGQVADYRRILKTFAADVLVADMCAFGAATLHDLGGPPYATIGINPLFTQDPEIPPFGSRRGPATSVLGLARNRISHDLAHRLVLARVLAAHDVERVRLGLPALPPGTRSTDLQHSPFLHLMPTTQSFEFPRRRLSQTVHYIGPLLPKGGGGERPAWWSDLAHRPVVHVTQGTVATDGRGLIRPTLDALATEDVLVVATTPEPESLGAIPGNARVARYIAHAELLPHVDILVTNGGYNGVLASLAHGVPLICAGDSEDKPEVAARVAWAGAGIDLRTGRPSARQVGDAVRTVLTDPAYRSAARRIAADFARHDPPREAADLLERLAARGSPVPRTLPGGEALPDRASEPR